MRIVFMGSPEFGLTILRALLGAGHELTLLVTQPDRPAGRARRLRPPAVAAFAREEDLPLYQPETLREAGARDPLARAEPEVIVVAAFGMLLPTAVLDLPPHGCLNVHPSLLPRYRGASPVQAAVLAGDAETGVTIIKLVEQMDAGPIVAQIRTPVAADEDAPTLEARLAALGAGLLVDSLEPWAAGKLVAKPQDERKATYCPRFKRADAELDWARPAAELSRVVRAYRGRPDAFTYWDDRVLKVLAVEVAPVEAGVRDPGVVFEPTPMVGPRQLAVGTGGGALVLREVALEGRSATRGEAFLNGYPGILGARLGSKKPPC
jgi:methionyl-tRNA formyltransferase